MARSSTRTRLTSLALVAMLFAAFAPAPVAAQATTTGIVFVFDGNGARVSGERVRRAVATGLGESVVRITDEAAHSARATVTLAFEAPDLWVLDIARGETHVARRVRLRTPTVGSLARVAIALVHDTEPAAPVPARPTTHRRDDDWVAAIGDEIIDPFGALPPTRRTRVVLDELVDPFGGSGGATTIASSRRRDGVIDPWAR